MPRGRRSAYQSNEEVFLGKQGAVLKKIVKEIKKMAATLKELKDQITAIATAVQADVDQDKKVVEAIDALLKALADAGTTGDFQEEVDALKAASANLTSDNTAVQEAIDKVVPPTPPTA